MSIPKLVRSFEASAAIGAFRIVRFSDTAASSKVAGAATATQPILGTTGKLGADAAGDMVDVNIGGLGDVTLGGTVTAGAPLTSDANAAAIVATIAGQRTIGFAHAPGVAGDVIPYHCAPGVMAV